MIDDGQELMRMIIEEEIVIKIKLKFYFVL